jgi:hypothetical protein
MKSKETYPEKPNHKGKKGQAKDPVDKTISKYTIVDEISIPQSDAPNKLIYLQKIEHKNKKIELRLCYYIIGKLPKMKGKWVFGQYATFLPAKDLKKITNEARKRGWI